MKREQDKPQGKEEGGKCGNSGRLRGVPSFSFAFITLVSLIISSSFFISIFFVLLIAFFLFLSFTIFFRFHNSSFSCVS